MICELDYLPTVLISILYFGCLVGYFCIPTIADNYGRKIAIKIAWVIYGLGVVLIGFSFHPSLVGIGEFMAGFGSNPAITLCFSFLNEQCLRKKRQRYGVIVQGFFGVGVCVIGLIFISDITWRYVFYILLGLIVLWFFFLFYLLETPKFLLSRKKKKILAVLNIMAKRNNKSEIKIEDLKDI